MTGFSIANLKKDVEDSAVQFGFAPDLEARFAKRRLGAERLGVSYQRLAPDARSPFTHRHKQQAEELYVVVEGSGRVNLDDESRDLEAWDVVHVAGAVSRSFEAGPEGLTILAFGEIQPAGDVEMVPDEEVS